MKDYFSIAEWIKHPDISKNIAYDVDFATTEIKRIDKNEIQQMLKDYKNLVNSDYRQHIMNEICKNPKIKKQFEEGADIEIGDKIYNLEEFLNSIADKIIDYVIEQIKKKNNISL